MIPLDCEKKFYPLTHPQKGIWYTEKLYPNTSIGNLAASLKIRGKIDYTLLEQAINIVIEKNDTFRIRIYEDEEGCKQYITPYEYRKLDFLDFSETGIESLYKWDIQQTQIPFQLLNSDLFQFIMLKIDNETGGFFVKLHHTIGDAWSFILIGNEVVKFYRKLLKNQEIENESYPSYLEYVESEKNYLASEKYLKDREYWIEKFSTLPEISALKAKKTKDVSIKAKRKTFMLPSKLCSKIRNFSAENRTSILTLFASSLALYINRVTGKEDIVIGTPVLNRTNAREKNMVGMFINTVPVRIGVINEEVFSDFVQKLSREWMSILKHQKYSFDFIIRDLREKFKSVDRLFEIAISYQNAKFEKDEESKGQEGRWHFNGYQTESLYIHINDREDDGNIVVDYDFLADLYHIKDIEYIHDHMIRLLWHSIDNPAKKLHAIEMISEKERNKVLYEFNNTDVPYPKNKMIYEFFEEQALKTPDKYAVCFGDRKVTYDTLNKKANQLARILNRKGIGKDSIIGIAAYRSFEMITAILAILKAGGAYLPIDPNFPAERVKYILEDSHASLLITSGELSDKIEFTGEKIKYSFDANLFEESGNLCLNNTSDSLAYVIYTSGSTGKPKGVMIEHHSVVNRLLWMQKKYPIGGNDTLLLKTPFTFDVSVWELMWWFFAGSSLAVLNPGDERIPNRVAEAINKYDVTVVHFVPSMLNAFLDSLAGMEDDCRLKSLKRVFASGEALSTQTVEKFNKVLNSRYGITLHNLYGPTEATVDVSFYDCPTNEKQRVIPIGKPIDNIKLYILDGYLNPLPVGATGELYISGTGLARGYINKPELTSERFGPNPFQAGQMLYKTGDLARWFPKGDIEYIGRIDHQIKVRGYRIELEEIRLKVLEIEAIKDAVVIFHNTDGRQYICAYYVPKERIDVSEIRSYLVNHLPSYMIPAFFIEIDCVPLTNNGKQNIAALPVPSGNANFSTEHIEPTNEVEREILDSWKNELQIYDIGIKDNFFEIGGDSLAAIRLATKLGKNITVEDIYKYPTVETLAACINNANASKLLVCLKEKTSHNDSTLVCFPYGGGNAYIYKPLAEAMTEKQYSMAVFSAVLPGHNPGSNEDTTYDIVNLADKIADEICQNIRGELILYGHCVGCALTVETARNLERKGRKVAYVCLGAAFPPVLTKFFRKPIDPWKYYSDSGLLNFIRMLGLSDTDLSLDYMKPVIKAFRQDVKYFYNYFANISAQEKHKLNAKIYSIVGDNDPLTYNYKKRFKSWFAYSNAVNLIILRNAKHYFIKSHNHELADLIESLICGEDEYTFNA